MTLSWNKSIASKLVSSDQNEYVLVRQSNTVTLDSCLTKEVVDSELAAYSPDLHLKRGFQSPIRRQIEEWGIPQTKNLLSYNLNGFRQCKSQSNRTLLFGRLRSL
jgi:hypothetical protein